MSQSELETSSHEPRSHDRAALLVLIIAVTIAMGRLCTNEFTSWDDPHTVYQNPLIQPPTAQTLEHYWSSSAGGLYIPLTYTAWAGIACFAQVPRDQFDIALNPWMFHAGNFICHLLAVIIAYRILRMLRAGTFASLCGAMLFGVHPVQVEAVAWVSGLKDVLSGMLALLAVWQYIAFSQSEEKQNQARLHYVAATIAFLLALLAKPSVMALPLTALAVDHWAVGRSWRKALRGTIPWILIAIPFAIIARRVQVADITHMPPIWMRPLIVCDSLAFYIQKLLWPVHLTFDYGRNPTTVIAHGWCDWDWIVPVIVAAFLISGARRRPQLLAAGTIFVAGCLPVLGFTPAMFQFFSTTADHYLYLSMFGPALALSSLLSVQSSAVMRAGVSAVLIVLIALSIRQGGYWKDDFTLFSHDTDVNPGSYIGYSDLGITYQRQRDLPHAIDAFQHALRCNPDDSISAGALASALSDSGQPDQAIAEVERALQLEIENPALSANWPQDNQLLGELLVAKGQIADAIPHLQLAANLEPNNQQLANELRIAQKRAATQPH